MDEVRSEKVVSFVLHKTKVVASGVTQAKAVMSIPSTIGNIAVTSTAAVVSGKATTDDVLNDVKNYKFFHTDETGDILSNKH